MMSVTPDLMVPLPPCSANIPLPPWHHERRDSQRHRDPREERRLPPPTHVGLAADQICAGLRLMRWNSARGRAAAADHADGDEDEEEDSMASDADNG
jgi:hypothetical protein